MSGITIRQTALVMLCTCALCLFGFLGVSAFGASNAAAGSESAAKVSSIPDNAGSYEPGKLIVGLDDSGTDGHGIEATKRAIESTGAQVSEVLLHASDGFCTVLHVSTDAAHRTGSDLAAAAEAIGALRGIGYVQPNYRYASATSASDVAGDQDTGEQYYLDEWGSSHGVNAAAAWGKVGTTNRVDVAVLDTGVYVMQEYDRTGSNLIVSADNFHQEFDDRNLDIEDGRDFVHAEGPDLPLVNKQNPYGDDNGHGTHMAGIIAAHAQTASNPDELPVGMAGVSQNARIIPLKVLNAAGEGNTADFIRAYDYLIQKSSGDLPSLRVVNLSFALMVSQGEAADTADDESSSASSGSSSAEWEDETGVSDYDPANPIDDGLPDNSAFQEAIQRAQNNGIATVCAVGNRQSEAVVYESYPSAYGECISVTALDKSGKDATYANNNGDEDIAAPGSGIYSAWGSQADAYATFDGTSQATAIVSGVLSMLWAKKADLTVDQAKQVIYSTGNAVPKSTLTMQVADAQTAEAEGVTAIPAAQTAADGGLSAGSIAQKGLRTQAVKQHYAIDAARALDAVDSVGSESSEEGGSSSSTSGTSSSSNASGSKPGSSSSSAPSTSTATKGDFSKAKVTLPKSSYAYTGKALKPAVTVKLGGKTLAASDYTLVYKNNKKVGKASVTVKGKGGYTGSRSATFKIIPKGTSVKKLAAGKKKFTIAWKKQVKQMTGYQVRYSLKKNMSKAKLKAVSKKKTALTVLKLKKGKRYYVQVRTYKKVGKAKYYSKWSAKKAVTVR